MPKSKGGKKVRRAGGKGGDDEARELITRDDGQEYAKVIKMLGGGRLTAECFDGKTRMCTIRGNMRKRVWIATGDLILVGLRDYQDDKADVLHKYVPEEARRLKALGELPENTEIQAVSDYDDGGGSGGFDFDDI